MISCSLTLSRPDELDDYNISINTLAAKDFLDYIHHLESLNIELTSKFILFISTLNADQGEDALARAPEAGCPWQRDRPRHENW